MTPNDFSHWLKGHYDMGGAGKPWSPAQAEMIARHLDLVFSAGPASMGQGPQAQFCRWLAGTLEANAELSGGAGVGVPMAKMIAGRLDACVKAGSADAEPQGSPFSGGLHGNHGRPPGAMAKC